MPVSGESRCAALPAIWGAGGAAGNMPTGQAGPMGAADPDRRLALEIADRLVGAAEIRRVATGLDSTYRVGLNDGRRVAIRVAGAVPVRQPTAVQMEAAWLRALRDSEVRVPEVIEPRDLEMPPSITDAEGRQRGYLVLSWLDGIKMRWRFTPRHARELGAAAAQLHRHAQDFLPPSGAWAKTWASSKLCGADGSIDTVVAVAGPGSRQTIEEVVDRLNAAYEELGGVDWTLINGDLGPHNCVWKREDPPGLFDFNDLGWGYTGFDFARYLSGLRWRPTGAALVDAALAGYQSEAPLPRSFVEHGRLFEVAAALFLAHYLADRVAERGEHAVQLVRELVGRAGAFCQANP